MAHINHILTRLYTELGEKLSREDGLSAMEYFVMMVGLVILVFVAFAFAGRQITSGVSSFFSTVWPG